MWHCVWSPNSMHFSMSAKNQNTIFTDSRCFLFCPALPLFIPVVDVFLCLYKCANCHSRVLVTWLSSEHNFAFVFGEFNCKQTNGKLFAFYKIQPNISDDEIQSGWCNLSFELRQSPWNGLFWLSQMLLCISSTSGKKRDPVRRSIIVALRFLQTAVRHGENNYYQQYWSNLISQQSRNIIAF